MTACLVCGTSLADRRAHARYCSARCRALASRALRSGTELARGLRPCEPDAAALAVGSRSPGAALTPCGARMHAAAGTAEKTLRGRAAHPWRGKLEASLERPRAAQIDRGHGHKL